MNLPNKLTILRTILVPVFIVMYLTSWIDGNQYYAAGIFVIASLTDFFDGYLARKYNLVTNFGKFLDPLADKMLVNSALLCMLVVPDNPLPFWVVLIIIMRDFIINGFRLVASDNNTVIAADYWGKVKTTVQMIMVIVVILNFDNIVMDVIEQILIYASVILTVVSLLDCLYKNRHVLSDKNNNIKLNEKIVNKYAENHMTIATAESCTGGMVASSIVEIPGASDVLKQSIITYCNDAKMKLLGVNEDVIKAYTEVSGQVAIEMAEGVCAWAGSDVGISVTGIAGPGGGSEEFPVGLVYIGVSYKGEAKAYKYIFKGSRNDIRKEACNKALSHALELFDVKE